MRTLCLRSLVLAATIVVAGSAEAQQKAAILSHEWLPAPKPDPNKPPPFPILRVKVRAGGVSLKKEDFKLNLKEGDTPKIIPAKSLDAFATSREDMALLVLVQGTVRFMGNPNPEPGEGEEAGTEIPGYFEPVKQAIDAFAKIRTKNTKGALYVYGVNVDAKVTMGPVAGLSGDGLGQVSDYAKINTKSLRTGLGVARDALLGEPGRRVLVVIGDGNDQLETWSVKEEAKKLEDASIEVYALCTTPTAVTPVNKKNCARLGELGSVQIVDQKDQFSTAVDSLAADINNVYTVEFPGQDAETGTTLPFDNEEHAITIQAKAESTEEKAFLFPLFKVKEDKPPEPTSLLWLWILLGVVGLLALIILAVVFLKKGGEEEFEEEPMVQAPPQPMLPVAPAAPAKPLGTMMLNVGGGDDSMPVVGWIVPINGPNAFQTFKLSQKTAIGKGSECQVHIDDPFMSSKHAEIVMNPGGFVIMDAGSTNGITVNQKKVNQHELVDNDVFTCGKTDFKYKSIN